MLLVRLLAFGLAAILVATPAAANVGMPMIGILLPEFLILLLPVIGLEAWILQKRLGIEMRRSLRLSAGANAVSTLLGVPLTWVVLLVLQQGTVGGGVIEIDSIWDGIAVSVLQAPWVVRAETTWVVAVAITVLFLAFFVVSWLLETAWITSSLRSAKRGAASPPRTGPASIRRAALIANLASYAMLYAGIWAFIAFTYIA